MTHKTYTELVEREMKKWEDIRVPTFIHTCPEVRIEGVRESYFAAYRGKVADFLHEAMLNAARATAEKLDVEDEYVTDCEHTPNDSCDSDCMHKSQNIGWNANNAERRRREREWLGEA